MEKLQINPVMNYSRTGKFFVKKYFYLINKDNYLSHLKDILSRKERKNFSEEFEALNSEESEKYKLKEDIFNEDYHNNHNEIIEEQKAKYLDPRDKYKYHTSHLKLIKKNKNKEIENQILINSESYKSLKKNIHTQSFEKMLGRSDLDINKESTIHNIRKKNNIKEKKFDKSIKKFDSLGKIIDNKKQMTFTPW